LLREIKEDPNKWEKHKTSHVQGFRSLNIVKMAYSPETSTDSTQCQFES
jgi:hypothetical protein